MAPKRTRDRSESTGKKSASAAGKTLASNKATKAQKSAAASALAQVGNDKVTSKKAASAAAKTLRSAAATRAQKSAAASALTQRPNRRSSK